MRAIGFLVMAVGINLPFPASAGNTAIFKEIVMSYANQGRAGLTTQIPIPFFIEITELAESLGVARHRLALLALRAGLPAAADQIRAEQATKAAQQPRATVKE